MRQGTTRHEPPHRTVPWGWQEDYIPAISPPDRHPLWAQGVKALPITHAANYTTWINIHAYTGPHVHETEKHTDYQRGSLVRHLSARKLTVNVWSSNTQTDPPNIYSIADIHDKTALLRSCLTVCAEAAAVKVGTPRLGSKCQSSRRGRGSF